MSVLRKLFWRFTLASLTGWALAGAPARAQGSGERSSADRAQARKRFAFEVVSIHLHKPGEDRWDTKYLPNGYRASFTVPLAIRQAYVPGPYKQLTTEIRNTPDWAARDLYDIDARVAEADVPAWQRAQDGVDSELLQSAMQGVLRERFKLALHMTPIEMPYLNLVVDKGGVKLKDTVPGAIKPVRGKTSLLGKGFYFDDNGKRQFVGVSMEELPVALMRLSQESPIQDKTGITGRYDFTLPWYGYLQYPASEMSNPLDRLPLSSIGLALKPGKGPGVIIGIDHIERPDPN
jgi:uncharacterized protein (TIGR03435 family)